MSSADRTRTRERTDERAGKRTRNGARAGLVLALALALAACQVRPLYGPAPGGERVDAQLSSIAIRPAAGRLGQIVRNELIFLLNGGGEPGSEFTLTLDTHASGSSVLVRQIGGEPQSRLINVRTAYQLFPQGAEKPVFQGAVTRQATYEWTNQRFANDRAQADAEKRAAQEVAEEIRLRLAAYFASGGTLQQEGSPELMRDEDEDALPGITGTPLDTDTIPGTDGDTGTGLLD